MLEPVCAKGMMNMSFYDTLCKVIAKELMTHRSHSTSLILVFAQVLQILYNFVSGLHGIDIFCKYLFASAMRFLLFTIAIKTITTMATTTHSKGNQTCNPFPPHLGKIIIFWLFSKSFSIADMTKIINCSNILHDDIVVKS